MNGQRLNIGRMMTMDLEKAVVDTAMRGRDTDTNAAICGALLGAALCGVWRFPPKCECVLSYRPVAGQAHVARPRAECFWPVDALDLAEQLLNFSSNMEV
jgi:hypothetical protein